MTTEEEVIQSVNALNEARRSLVYDAANIQGEM